MVNIDNFERENMKVLGILVRYKRLSLGHSLRDLSRISNISHTLISNFERGVILPHSDTIKDIFKVLDLTFYDDPSISIKFSEIYNIIYKKILYCDYDDALTCIKDIEKDSDIYENSKEVINYSIIRSLYFVMADTVPYEEDKLLSKYEVVLEFFSENQKQLYYFIKGKDYINKQAFKSAREYFEKALVIGDRNVDSLIKEQYVVSLSRANKYVDAKMISDETIKEFESQTNYIRAMHLRINIANDYVRIHKFDEAVNLLNYINDFAVKFNVKYLQNACYTKLSHIAMILNDFKKSEEYILLVTPPYVTLYFYIKLDIEIFKNNKTEFYRLYNEYMSINWIRNHSKTKNFLELMKMRFDPSKLDKKRKESILKVQIKNGFINDDGLFIEVASRMLIDFYKDERLYKKALDVSEALLHYNKFRG